MSKKICKVPLWECSATLSAVAMGNVPAETVILDAKLVNVCTHEICEHIDVRSASISTSPSTAAASLLSATRSTASARIRR